MSPNVEAIERELRIPIGITSSGVTCESKRLIGAKRFDWAATGHGSYAHIGEQQKVRERLVVE